MTDAQHSPDAGARLTELSRRLDETAARLGEDGLDAEEAKHLAGRCAELAAEAAVELDQLVRGGPLDNVPGQEELL
jgi:hypothetical protein